MKKSRKQPENSPLNLKLAALAVSGLLVASFVNFTGSGSGLARAAATFAAYETDMGRYPRRGGVYDSTGGTTYPGTIQTEMISMSLRGPSGPNWPSDRLPDIGTSTFQIDSFFDVFTEISIDGTTGIVEGPASVSLVATNNGRGDTSTDPPTGTWDTEMVALSLTGVHPSGQQVELRLSSLQPSLGSDGNTDLGNGLFQVDSFFDVFTEISIDGSPFVPAESSFRLDLSDAFRIPEPSTLGLALLAGVALCFRRHRSGE